MTTRHPFKLPDKMPKEDHDVSWHPEECPVTNHPMFRWTKRGARKVRRLRQKVKDMGIKTIIIPVYTITKLP